MQVGDKIELQKQDVEVIKCEDCGALMVNIDADEIQAGDLKTLKRKGVRISNPETEKPICLKCEFNKVPFGQRLSKWFDSDDDDDNSFFSPPSRTSRRSSSTFGGSSGGGGFGGFGGGGFSGGGASRGF